MTDLDGHQIEVLQTRIVRAAWLAACKRYLAYLTEWRGAGGGLTDTDREFLCRAAELHGCAISQVVSTLSESADDTERTIAKTMLEYGVLPLRRPAGRHDHEAQRDAIRARPRL